MALHGGSQDRGTDRIARRAADLCGASYYAIVQPPWLRVHLTSRLHDPDQSTAFRRFLAHVRVAISVHGFGRDSFALWVDPTRGLVIDAYGPWLTLIGLRLTYERNTSDRSAVAATDAAHGTADTTVTS